MSNTRSEQYRGILQERLAVLDGLLNKAEAESKDANALINIQLAPDMANFGKQIDFVCGQINGFCAWIEGRDKIEIAPDPADFTTLHAMIKSTMAEVKALELSDDILSKMKTLELPNDISFEQTGQQYLDDWILPNVYFHMVTAYNILRSQGIGLGKADFLSFLGPRIMAQQK